MATIQIKRGLQEAVSRLTLAQGELAVALDTGNVYVGTTSGNIHVNPTDAATLTTARNFSITGDGTAQAVQFDGSADVALQLVLAKIDSLKAGTYAKVTVNEKGLVTTGEEKIQVTDISGVGPDGKLPESAMPDLSTTYLAVTTKGTANGVASLDEHGKVPVAQLPSYVDEIVEGANKDAFPEAGEAGKIYVALDTNLAYRWGGSQYVEISPSIALGETASTAFAGDKGKIAYDHSQVKTGNPHGTTAADVGAAPADHTDVKASAGALGHIKPGAGFEVTEDGTLNLVKIDGGTFA